MDIRSPAIKVLGPSAAASLRAALSLLTAAGLAHKASADILSWNAGSGSWSNVNNWSPVGTPAQADTARLGNLAGIANSIVTLNVDPTISSLEITDGMTLRTNANDIVVLGPTTISGANVVGQTTYPSTLRAEPGGPLTAFSTFDLQISNGGRLLIQGGVAVVVDRTATIGAGSLVSGEGTLACWANAGDGIINNGEIRVAPGGLHVHANGGQLDLDGTSGDGLLSIDTQSGTGLRITGTHLHDAFSGQIHLTSNSLLNMDLSEAWTADAASSITVEGIIDVQPRPPARIEGIAATFAGDITVGGFSGHLLVTAPAELQPTLGLSIGTQDQAQFLGQTTINGGTFTLAQDAALDFNGPTVIHGGTFNTATADPADGLVNFNGNTEWAGTVIINGAAFQGGDAVVSAPTIITADFFNLDGPFDTSWDIDSGLVLNAGQIDDQGNNYFNGTLDISGGIAARLTINLSDPGSSWTMDGTMNLAAATVLVEERVAGSPMHVHGSLNVSSGKVRISADTTFSSSGQTDIAPAAAILYMGGQTTVESGAEFTGLGTLQNNAVGTMTLEDGASLDTVGLVNQGVLSIGPDAGAASVDRFQNAAQGTWRISIAGPTAGSEHDTLIVSGAAATLAGTIQVDLPGAFRPHIGDEFTVLTALGGVTGAFANNPVSSVDDGTYQWHVIYNPNTVVLRLESITPACYANCDGSTAAPVLNVSDFACFLNRFAAGDTYANCDESTTAPVLNVRDFSCFLNAFAAGCS